MIFCVYVFASIGILHFLFSDYTRKVCKQFTIVLMLGEKSTQRVSNLWRQRKQQQQSPQQIMATATTTIKNAVQQLWLDLFDGMQKKNLWK